MPRCPLPLRMFPASLALLLACGDAQERGAEGPAGAAPSDDTGAPPADGCRATPRPADADRAVLTSLPYTDDLDFSPDWAVLRLDAGGVLGDTDARIPLGTARGGGMAFTPDGSIGVATLDDGTLGVASVSGDGTAAVVQAGFDPGTYVTSLAMDPTGEAVWLVNPNWADSGGGLYRAGIDCETGEVGPASLVIAARNPSAIVLPRDSRSRGVLVGGEIPGATPGADLALLDLESGAVLSSSDAFGDDDAIVSRAAIAASGWILVGDHSEFSGQPNRVAAVRIDGDSLGATLLVDDVYDPVSIVPNPLGPGALVPSGYGDRYWLLGEAPDGARPWFLAGQVQEDGQTGVQLPDGAVTITRDTLAGHVLSIEVGGVRQLDLDAAGGAVLRGVLDFGSGYSGIPGAIGVQP